MKNYLIFFIILITIFSAINSVNSIDEKKTIIQYFNYKTNISKNVCLQNEVNKSYYIKNKNLQKMSLSCEISAASDILSYLENKKITEKDLLKKLSKSEYNKLPKYKNNQFSWWDPIEWFVGYIDKLPNGRKAMQRKMTGYWVLEKPIAKIFNSYWYKTQIINSYDYNKNFDAKKHLSLILQEFKNWNMIQMWWDICTNPKYYSNKEHKCFYNWELSWNKERKISWKYKDINWNTVIYNWLNWEHAFYLLGFKWTIQNPTDIIVWDTYSWLHIYPTNEWMRKWWKMQYRSIIIYNK